MTRKAAQRIHLLSTRKQLSNEQLDSFSDHIIANLTTTKEFKAAKTVFCYVSFGSEVITHDLIKGILASEKAIAVPKIIGNTMQAIVIESWQALKPAAMGILEPPAKTPVMDAPDLIITPGVGFSPTGHRLGYGKAYYDRWFGLHPHGHRIGLAYACQILDDLAVENTDIPMDRVITETGGVTYSASNDSGG